MSDWWTQPATPARASSFATPARASMSSSRSRFVSDDPDPSASDGPKFLPSFAQSPAGKVALGSPSASAASPPVIKRSPQTRFTAASLNESASSPRQSLALSRSARPSGPVPMDEDPIPTSSLYDDSASSSRPAPPAATPQPALATPSTLEANADTTTLHVFGPPVEHLSALRPYLENIGPVVSYVPGPDGSNWWTVQYADALFASYALRRHGEIVSGRWMLAFKVAGPGSTQGLTLVNGVAPPVGNTQAGPGTPFEIKSTNIIRAKPKQEVQKDDYAWEEPEQPTSILGRAAELIFGR
ncbi:hypothetical protein Q8F55_000363 [Vanrija albida]|uniref:RRM Nup35-type domain-containing protein n=1 Tax=Vanrija albida TaxID=181172 RepID=A0ABR3QD20_9TREE